MEVSATEVISGLWLGNIQDSKNKEFICRMDVIVNCTKNLPFLSEQTKNIRLPIDDNLEKIEVKNLYNFFPKIIPFIYDCLKKNLNVFVHCYAGKQRSVSVVVAYLMKYLDIPLNKAITLVRTKREIIFTPYTNFNAALLKFEKSL